VLIFLVVAGAGNTVSAHRHYRILAQRFAFLDRIRDRRYCGRSGSALARLRNDQTAPSLKQRTDEGVTMLRSLLAIAVIVAIAGPAWADRKSECMRGVSMMKSELKKKHADDVRQRLQQALTNAENEVVEIDWSECATYITEARKALRR
jgi:hypothetical protein